MKYIVSGELVRDFEILVKGKSIKDIYQKIQNMSVDELIEHHHENGNLLKPDLQSHHTKLQSVECLNKDKFWEGHELDRITHRIDEERQRKLRNEREGA